MAEINNYYDVEKNIEIAVDDGRAIKIITYSMGESIEHNLKSVISNILKKYDKSQFMETIYTGVKELAINATKANMKHIIFEELGMDINDPVQYEEGMKLYKERLTEEWIAQYGHKAKERDVSVKITFFHDKDGLRVVIKNNIPISDFDEERIREKLAKVMQYDDLVQFYMENADETEGQGLGIGLIVMLLKGENINPHLFRIGIIDRNTTARIEIPFTDKFVSTREKKLLEKIKNESENNNEDAQIEEEI